MEEPLVILGLDITYTSTGWSVLSNQDDKFVHYGVFKSNESENIDKCLDINAKIFELIVTYEPNIIYIRNRIDKLHHHKTVMMQSVVRAFLSSLDQPPIIVNQDTFASFVTGDEKAPNKAINNTIKENMHIEVSNTNTLCAIGLAIYGVRQYKKNKEWINAIL